MRRKAALDLLQMSFCMAPILKGGGKQQVPKHRSTQVALEATETRSTRESFANPKFPGAGDDFPCASTGWG